MKKIIGTSIIASILLIGCGSSSDTSSANINLNTTDTTGQLVDSYLENVDYRCGDFENTHITNTTNENGTFKCSSLPVGFYLGGLKLGEISASTPDNQVFPQDLVGVSRTDYTNKDVIALARFMQSCDEDGNPANGIKIHQDVKDSLKNTTTNFASADLEAYATDLNLTLVDENATLKHLTQTTEFVNAVNNAPRVPSSVQEALLTPLSTLTQEAKDTLSYMINEERLAYDVYNKLFESYPAQTTLNTIASKSEYTHISIVQLLAKKYITTPDEFTNTDLPAVNYDTNITDMEAGKYDISEIQDLYDALVEKGTASEQNALEVACMVEVTDINDLLEQIEIAKDSNASDIVTSFEFLRDGSYTHYWAFDRALKAMGVTEGCCVLGTLDDVNYCHDDYPQVIEYNGGQAESNSTSETK